jgi:hypothetical protein
MAGLLVNGKQLANGDGSFILNKAKEKDGNQEVVFEGLHRSDKGESEFLFFEVKQGTGHDD